MSSFINRQAGAPFRVDLDSEITAWPGHSLQSLSAIFLHLEKMALRQNGAAGSLWENENMAKLHELALRHPAEGIRPAPRGLSFRGLGRQILDTAKAQVQVLQERAHEVQSLLLINDWPVAQRLWRPLQAECRTPLYELNFLEDFWGFDPQQWPSTPATAASSSSSRPTSVCSWPGRRACSNFPIPWSEIWVAGWPILAKYSKTSMKKLWLNLDTRPSNGASPPHSAFRILHSAFCLLHSAFRLLPFLSPPDAPAIPPLRSPMSLTSVTPPATSI